jgi:hypothetical protein
LAAVRVAARIKDQEMLAAVEPVEFSMELR